MVNGADGGGAGMLDEEMERKLFQEAVMEWRRSAALDREGGGGKASGSVEDGEPVGGRRAGVQSKSLYEQSQLDLDEEEERKAFQEAVMQWRGSDKKAGASQAGSGMWSNPLAGDDHEAKDYSRRGMGSRGSLAVGALDEDAERKVRWMWLAADLGVLRMSVLLDIVPYCVMMICGKRTTLLTGKICVARNFKRR